MPYAKIKKKNGRYKVVNKDTGRILAHDSTSENADAMIRLLYAKEHNPDWKPTGKKS